MTTSRPRAQRRFDDAGQVAGMEVLPFGFLVFVSGALLLANAWAVVDAKFAVDAAARQAVRAYVEASSQAEAERAAVGAATAAIGAHGLDPDDLALELDTAAPFGRCVTVTVVASIEVPAVRVPFIGGFGRRMGATGTSTEIVDPFRSGLPGEAACGL